MSFRSPVTSWVRVRGIALGAALLLAVAGCGSAQHPPAARGKVVAITERDFHIGAPLQIPAGPVTLRVHNEGPDMHELLVFQTNNGKLPFRSDGFTIDEDALAHVEPGSLEPGQPGAVRELALNLKPGRYELICNMSGHYLGGMHSTLVVS